jgi:hypothetical protein
MPPINTPWLFDPVQSSHVIGRPGDHWNEMRRRSAEPDLDVHRDPGIIFQTNHKSATANKVPNINPISAPECACSPHQRHFVLRTSPFANLIRLIEFNTSGIIMPLPSQRTLAPAFSALAPQPPIASKTTLKRTKISRACSACQERRSKVGTSLYLSVYRVSEPKKKYLWIGY